MLLADRGHEGRRLMEEAAMKAAKSKFTPKL
jgi:hypothetical protein